MFTGIVEGLGRVKAVKGPKLTVKAPTDGFQAGDSVAVNGVCLTVVKNGGSVLDFDVSPETFKLTNLGALKAGAKVNIERPLTPQAPIGGHYVTGHVDKVETIIEKDPSPYPLPLERKRAPSPVGEGGGEGQFIRLRFSLSKEFSRFVAVKGSVTLDGVSLTVTAVGKGWAETVLVPHTLGKTTLGLKGPGDLLNLEVDLLARYVQRLLETR